jgi:hypothetical protein
MNSPLVIKQFAIENGHRNSSFPHSKMVIFNSYVNVYQRVYKCHENSPLSTDWFKGTSEPETMVFYH